MTSAADLDDIFARIDALAQHTDEEGTTWSGESTKTNSSSDQSGRERRPSG